MNDDEFDRLLRERHQSFVAELTVRAPTPPHRVSRRDRTAVLTAALLTRVAPRIAADPVRALLVSACLIIVAVFAASSLPTTAAPGSADWPQAIVSSPGEPTSRNPRAGLTNVSPGSAPPTLRRVELPPNLSRVEITPVEVREVVEFVPDTTQLTSRGDTLLGAIMVEIRNRPHARIGLVGRTATIGPVDAAVRLSADRAYLVRERLVAGGVGAERIRVEARGYADPLVADLDRDGTLVLDAAQRNRSVEIVVKST
ncbi:OmpA family protein [Actinosynnema sp. NPDC047251]|uniref:OmpA-like domain-containing protein n=1 Tax=Saccharothrix espanaensis (strain ATCC 51144 / DSM 44229 / JCM 9112 / NBRC 15066 / NRRL 15764) TaxID=1179773 RepID=K0JQP3_SACES|nr:OmpA family protein [Saccharothrix espanaensis]CCH27996.1 hypothetical protein BN6_06680 [Saccharothrix espanaensis DSM 44229]